VRSHLNEVIGLPRVCCESRGEGWRKELRQLDACDPPWYPEDALPAGGQVSDDATQLVGFDLPREPARE